jgi:hypothetical protein
MGGGGLAEVRDGIIPILGEGVKKALEVRAGLTEVIVIR